MLATLLILSAMGPVSRAQSRPAEFDATLQSVPVALDGVWLIHAGDDPSYANPAFDDSNWTPFDPHNSVTTIFPKVHPEVIWYRQRIKVSPRQTGLALKEESLSHAFEIYVNGERLIASGQVEPLKSYTLTAKVLQPIPDRLLASGTLVVALRVRITPGDWVDQNPGFYVENLTLGQLSTLQRDDWLSIIGEHLLSWLNTVLFVGVGLVALALFAAQRRQPEYLWIFALGMMRFLEAAFYNITLFYNLPVGWQFVSAIVEIAAPFVLVSMYFAFVHIRIGWKFRIYLIFAGLLNAFASLGNLLPTLPGNYQLLVNLPFVTLLSIVIPIVLAVHWRRGNREAGILLIPVILLSLYIYANYTLALLFAVPDWRSWAANGLNLIQRYPLGPFAISLNQLSGILSTISLALIMVLRSSSMSRRQTLLEGELAAAREVQQVMLPEQFEGVPGFILESIYEPAQQVGGDFFQVLPTEKGGLFVVVGDVAGKGLPAAMLVSVLVGAIRTAASYSHAPEEVLAQLNERLIGRARGGFSTALAAHITASGKVTIANAGHLSPYLDGEEIHLPGALPLGIVPGIAYETMQFRLETGSRLTFYSDGVIEAQNSGGELLGFERGRELSTQPAIDIVEAAKRFGQSDDITVVAVTRIQVLDSVAAAWEIDRSATATD